MMPAQPSVNDRVLLHLSRFATDTPPEEYPSEATQVGIAEGVGISRTHVPRAVRTLMKEGLVDELRGRVANRDRRMSVYSVSAEGFRRAEKIWAEIKSSKVAVLREGRREEMDGETLEGMVGRRKALELVSRMRDGVVEFEGGRRTPVRALEDAPDREEFFGRGREIDLLESFLSSESHFMVVLGGKGWGTTSLVREFVERKDDIDVLWITIDEDIDAAKLEDMIVAFAGRVKPGVEDLGSALALQETLIVLDEYHSVGEGVVEFLSSIVNSRIGSKIIVTAREDLPAYNWFYQKRHVDSRTVTEIRVRGLDEDSARRLLGNPDIETEAFRRVYLMSRGQPLILRLLRDEDREELKRNSVFTAEEIRYLMFLKGKTG